MLQPEQFFQFGFKSQDICYLFHDATVFQYVKLLFRTLPQRDLNTPITFQSLQSYRTILVVDKESQFWGTLPTVFLEPLWDALPQAEWWVLDGLGSPQHWHTSRITQKPILKTDQTAYSPIDPQRTYKKLHHWVEFQKRYIPQAKPIQTIKWCSTTTHVIPIALQLFHQYYEETTTQSLLFRRTLLGLLHDTTTPDGILHIPFESLYHAHPRLYLHLSYTAYLRHLVLLIEDAFPQCPWVMEQDFPEKVEEDAKQLRQWRGCYISQQQKQHQTTTTTPRDQCFYYAVSPQYYQSAESRSIWVRLFWKSLLAQPWVEWRQVEWENPSHPPPDCVFLSSPIEPTPTAYQGLPRFIIDPERRHSHQVLPNTYIIQWDTTPSCQGIQWSGAVMTLPVGIDPAFWRWYEMFHNATTSPIQLIQGEYPASPAPSPPFRYWMKRSNSQQHPQQIANLIETADELEWVFCQAGSIQPTEFQPTWTQTENFLFRVSSFMMGTQSQHILKITPYEVHQWRQTATFVALLCGVKPSLHASLFEFKKKQNPPLLPQHPQWIPFTDIAWEDVTTHHLQPTQSKKQLSLSREWLRGDIWRDVVQQMREHTSRRLSLVLYIWYVNTGMYQGVYPRRRSFTTQQQQQKRVLLWNTGATPPFNSEGHRYLMRHFEDESAFTSFQVLPLLNQQFHYYRFVDATLPFISWEWEGQYPQQTPTNQLFVIENEWETFHDPEKTKTFSLLRAGSQPRSQYVKSQTALMDCLMDARFQNPNIQTDTVYDPIAPVQDPTNKQFTATATTTNTNANTNTIVKKKVGCVVSSQEEMQWVSSLRKHHPQFTFLIYYLHEGTTQQERESLLYRQVDMVCEPSKTRQYVVLEALNHCLPVCMRLQNPLSVDITRDCEAKALPFPGVVIQYDELTKSEPMFQHFLFYQTSWVESAAQCVKTQWNPKYIRWLWNVSFTPSQSLSVYPQITVMVGYYQLEEWDLEGILQTIQQQVGFGRLYELEVLLISNGNHCIYRHQKLIAQYREMWEDATNGFVRVKEYHQEEHEKQTEQVYQELLQRVSYEKVYRVEGMLEHPFVIIENVF